MSSGTHAMCSPSPSHSITHAGGHWLAQSVKGLWRAYWAHRARRASVLFLSSLDNRTLQDIGLDRSEIESFVNDKTHQRRRRYEPNWE
jgi:uncharacterized protein YjiS (DUF1127 family)